MKKYFFIALLFVTGQITLFSQNSESIKRDSLLIVSLQKKLPGLRDTARINCMNEIAKAFLNVTITPGRWDLFKNKIDSGHMYVDIAYRESMQIGYKYGIAQSLMTFLNVCNMYYTYNRKKRIDNGPNWKKSEEYQKQLFDLASQMNDAEIWGMTYSFQSDVLAHKNNRREDVIGALKNSLTWFKKAGDEKRESNVCTYVGWLFCSNGEYEKGFEYCNRGLQLAKKINKNADPDDESNEMVQEGLEDMSGIYKAAGDYETALDFLRESRQFHATHNASNTGGMEAALADMFLQAGQYDSCFYYLKAQLASRDLYDQLT
ncbi:MAG: hypothetical protein ACHQF0_17320, partial [Chitinophagales bacterium]